MTRLTDEQLAEMRERASDPTAWEQRIGRELLKGSGGRDYGYGTVALMQIRTTACGWLLALLGEVDALRAQVDTLTRERDDLKHAKPPTQDWVARDFHARTVERLNALNADLGRRAESAEAERDALADDGVALLDEKVILIRRAESAEARIQSVERTIARMGSDPNHCSGCSIAYLVRAALREPVGEPQPEPCATCGGSRWVPFPLPDADDTEKTALPCPRCVPPTTESEQR